MLNMFASKPHNISEQQCFEAFTPPITVTQPDSYAHGIIFASPHSGRVYPPAFTNRTRLPLAALRRNEDALMDELIAPLSAAGYPTLRAHFPRCYVDVNRAPDELSPEWVDNTESLTARAKAGLGVIPTAIAEHLPIYKTPLPKTIVTARLEKLYAPYHNALQDLMAKAKMRAGLSLLLDCHSMPGTSTSGRQRQDIILGDRFGASAHPDLVHLVEKIFKAAGYSVTRNYPYAGGHVTSHYGTPDTGSHVIQIEVNRQIYMNPANFKRTKGFEPLQKCFLHLAKTLHPYVAQDYPRAAE